jgi:glycosyltransferase involved in cell wall biosynthesis
MKKRNRILVFIKNMKDPSAYYRIGQYLQELYDRKEIKYIQYAPDLVYKFYYDNAKGNKYLKKVLLAFVGIIRVTFYIIWDILINHSKVIIINRQMYPRIMPFFGRALMEKYLKSKTLYWDFDDNIIHDQEITITEKELLEKYSTNIIVTNNFLKSTLGREFHDKVKLLYTTDDTFKQFDLEVINSRRLYNYNKQINIVWIGTKSNLKYLYKILPEIDLAAEEINRLSGKTISLQVVCNENIMYETKHIKVNNITWTRQIAEQELLLAHIGIMPLEDSEFTRGKGGFKGIQYISAGVPCIMSNVGYNAQVIQHEISGYLIQEQLGWNKYIVELSTNFELWKSVSIAARRRWEENFNSDVNKDFWYELLK